jgi:VWFA-related protein
MNKKIFSLVFIAFLVFSLAGCGGGGGSSSNGTPEGSDTPNISVSGSSVDFAGVVLGNSLDKTIVITNAGSANLNIGAVSVSNAAFSIVAPDAASNATLAPAQTCSLNVRFTPAAQGQASATLSIPSNDPDSPNVDVSLAGEGYGLNVWINQVTGDCSSMSVNVTVTDPVNPITDLTQSNFTLYVNGTPTSFSLSPIEMPTPVSVVLSMDASASLVNITQDELYAAADDFVDRMSSSDEAALSKFTEDLYFYPVIGASNPFISTNATGKTALKLWINDAVDAGTQTHLYDAAYQSVTRAALGAHKKAVVLFSDGSDSDGSGTLAQGSTHSLSDVIAYANELHVPLFTIFYVDPAYQSGSRGNPTVMQRLADETGGLFYNANTTAMDTIFHEITNVLSNQYTLTFTPATCTGSMKIDVLVNYGDPNKYGMGTKTADQNL